MSSTETLTEVQAEVLAIVRKQCRLGDPVSASIVRDCAWPRISYDRANRALTALVAKGFVEKKARGWYLPRAAFTDPVSEDRAEDGGNDE